MGSINFSSDIATLFAACTGIAGASVIAIGLIALPSMLTYGYDRRMASGVICAGKGLGVIISPSIMMILYGPVAGVSISPPIDAEVLFVAAMKRACLQKLYNMIC